MSEPRAAKKKPDAFRLLRSYLRVECEIVQSERDPELLSIRPVDVQEGEGGKATTLKRRLTEAGFKVGQKVMIVPTPRQRRTK